MTENKEKDNSISYIPPSLLDKDSRSDDFIVAFGTDAVVTWREFVSDVAKIRLFLESRPDNLSWVLHCEDAYYFTIALLAMLQAKRKALVAANIEKSFINEIREEKSGFLTDVPLEDADLVQDVLQKQESDLDWKKIDRDSAEIVIYTSGTTGKSKAVPKRFLQFENELHELVKCFGNKWQNRKVFSTVNHHHIYGLLFTSFLPVATGLPLCRRNISCSKEIHSLVDENALIVSSPAFLKRFTQEENEIIPFEKSPEIFSSGGPLLEEVSRKIALLMNTWVTEIYGSTETGGIAYRQIKNGSIWKPFEVCKTSLAENKCLNVKSNYILEPEGFTTGDLAEIYEDGSFILRGRADYVVKVEDKKISLADVEKSLMSTRLLQDVCVVPMEGKSQYLAAALVLNSMGVRQFENLPKEKVNAYFKDFVSKDSEELVPPQKWVYLEELPQDTQGKIKRLDVQALFDLTENPNFHILKISRESSGFFVKMVFTTSGNPPEMLLDAAVMIMSQVFLKISIDLQNKFLLSKNAEVITNKPILLKVAFDAAERKISYDYCAEDNAVLLSAKIGLFGG